ncbi:MAG: 4-amino-4-deoxy-L-arabinose transferase-like glycosyltransferase [Pseudohongiellaceae bacterium]|jgi:4-amino-4-deoxy-L-arabinose transferase-like glycosyltransferase
MSRTGIADTVADFETPQLESQPEAQLESRAGHDGSLNDGAPSVLERWLPWVLLSAYAVLCLTLWLGDQWLSSWDSAVYLMTGRSLAEGAGYAYQGLPYSLRPPAFSWILSFFLSDGAFDPGAINALVMACAAAAVAAVFVVFRKVYGTWIALAAALLSGTSPAFVANFNRILSEYPFQLLVFVGFGCVLAADARRKGWLFWAACAGLTLGAAMWFRSVAVLAVPGFFVGGLLRADRWRWWAGALLPTVMVIAIALPWISASKVALGQAPVPSEQWLLYDYGSAMFHVDPGDPASEWVDFSGYIHRVGVNGTELASELAYTCSGSRSVPARIAVILLLAVGWLVSVRRRATVLDWFAAIYTVLVLTYFTYALRLVLPLMPFVPLYALLALRALASSAGKLPSLAAVALGVLLLAAANGGTLAESLNPADQNGGRLAQRWADNATTAQWLRDNTPEDAVLLCRRAPELAFLSERRAYTYRFQRQPGLAKRHDVDYVIYDTQPPKDVGKNAEAASLQSWTLPSASRSGRVLVHRVQ